MDTILNLGLNDQSVEALAKRTNNPRFAYDSYRRLIQMFGNVVLDVEKSVFEEIFDAKKHQKKTKFDTGLDAKALQEVIVDYKLSLIHIFEAAARERAGTLLGVAGRDWD